MRRANLVVENKDMVDKKSSGTSVDLARVAHEWLREDWKRVELALGAQADAFLGRTVLVTGAAGFLGFGFLHFFAHLNGTRDAYRTQPVRVVAVDNYLRGEPRWIVELATSDSNLRLKRADITAPWQDDDKQYDFIIHGASVASPTFYRQYPLETLDANVQGLRHMLDLARSSRSSSMLFFSSSEIYGDPPAHEIPTKETYRGNVASIGPRACYDESKRLGETLCYIYATKHNVPVKIVRPFNNYGPGLRLADRRVLPDFCANVIEDRPILLLSDGKPSRTFCYSSDALAGYLLTLLSSLNGEAFNIGADSPEISMRDLAELVAKIGGSRHGVHCQVSGEADYLTDNPWRRCPDLSKARTLLGYRPTVLLDFGVRRLLEWYRRFLPLEQSVHS